MTGLAISTDLQLPLEAVTSTFAILAIRRAGKSNAAVVLAEELYDAGLPWVAVDPKGDWWGVRAAGDGDAPGLSVLVFGGLHADVPLEPTSGHLVADLVVDQRLTCVLDVSEMTKADQRRFLTAFADRLYKRNREPLHVICEEADEYIPQRVQADETKLVRAFEVLVKRGGFRGIGVTLVSQRSAVLNKNVLTQVETLIALRTTSPQDRKVISEWVNHHAAGAAAVAELPGLGNGEAWLFSPAWLNTLERIQFRRRRTFDSGATPKVGQKPRTPTRLADVDVDAIAAAMAETIEKAKAEDPKALQKRIRELEQQTRDLLAAHDPGLDPDHVQTVVDQVLAAWRSTYEAHRNFLNEQFQVLEAQLQREVEIQDLLSSFTKLPTEGKQGKPTTRSSAPRATSTSSTSGRAPDAGSSASQEAVGRAPAGDAPRQDPADAPHLKAGARRLLDTLARQSPLTRAQLSTLAGFKVTGGTFGTYLSTLKRTGYLVETAGRCEITDAGFARSGVGAEAPMSTEDVVDLWRSKLKAGARRMLDAVIDVHPSGIDRDALADQLDMAADGGTFGTYLSTLRRNGLVENRNGVIHATDALFMGAHQ